MGRGTLASLSIHAFSAVVGAFLFASVASSAQQPVVRIGVVIDGPWERNDEIERLFQRELLELTRGEFDVRFPAEARAVGDWTVDAVDLALERALADPAIDLRSRDGRHRIRSRRASP